MATDLLFEKLDSNGTVPKISDASRAGIALD